MVQIGFDVLGVSGGAGRLGGFGSRRRFVRLLGDRSGRAGRVRVGRRGLLGGLTAPLGIDVVGVSQVFVALFAPIERLVTVLTGEL